MERKVLRRHGIGVGEAWRDVSIKPRFLLGLTLPNFAHGESVGRRIRDVDDEAGLLLYKFVESGGTFDRMSLDPFRWLKS